MPPKISTTAKIILITSLLSLESKSAPTTPPATTPTVAQSVGCQSTTPFTRYTIADTTVNGSITSSAVAWAFFCGKASTVKRTDTTSTPPPPPKKPLIKPDNAPSSAKIHLFFAVSCIVVPLVLCAIAHLILTTRGAHVKLV